MSSEAEFERLYQEWIRNGGGAVTLAETNTPAEYYDGVSSTDLTPEQLAELQARQSHYNRTQALQVFSSEISANNFTNPYDARSTASINAFTNFATSPGVLAMAALSSAFSSAFSDAGLSSTETSLLLAGLSSALGVDFSNMLLVAGLSGAAIPMYSSLQNHTNSQITNLPQTLEQASSLADMNQQFGEQADSCSLFNELMGLMSGAFDGIMDFMDAGLDKVKELLGPVIGAISDITAGITGAITDGISSIVGAISDMIPQSIKDVFNEIGNIANSMMNGIAALANQITSEIANLKSMADSIAAKLAALALAAATLDPCKLAVLLNTGSPELKSAAQNMISPVTNVVSNIATELDPRANADEVNTIVEEAKNAAATAAGVPQSPMTLAAKLYSPFDSYLHDIEPDFSSIFNTDEKFTSTETQSGNSIVTKLPETGSSPSSRLDSKGATPSSRLDSKGATPKSDNEIPTPTSTREFESEVFATWKKNYLTDFLKIRSDAAMIRSEIERVLDTAHFPNTALKGESKNLVDNARKIIRRTKAHMNAVKVSLSYTSNTGSRDPDKEITARDTYIDRYLNGSHTRREKFKRELDTIQRSWNSIRSQVIYNGPR